MMSRDNIAGPVYDTGIMSYLSYMYACVCVPLYAHVKMCT